MQAAPLRMKRLMRIQSGDGVEKSVLGIRTRVQGHGGIRNVGLQRSQENLGVIGDANTESTWIGVCRLSQVPRLCLNCTGEAY